MNWTEPKKICPLKAKTIKLRFNNINLDEITNSFDQQDIAHIDNICDTIEDTLNQGKQLDKGSIGKILNMLKKLRRTIENGDSSEASKKRFRIAKSSRKLFQSKEIENDELLDLNPGLNQIENKSDLLFTLKESSLAFRENRSTNAQANSTGKFKRVRSVKKEHKAEINNYVKEEQMESLKKKLLSLQSDYDMKIEEIKELKKGQKNLNPKLFAKEPIFEDTDIIKIDLHCSLKFINLLEETTLSKNSSSSLIEKSYEESMQNHLQMMVVSQNKEIESLYNKLIEIKKLSH